VIGEWIIGFVGSLLIAGLAYWKRSLSLSGSAAACILGTLMYALGSLAWFGTLIAFFISSTILSKLKHKRKSAAESGYAKGSRRDAGQVAANGGVGLLLCIAGALWPDPIWWVMFVGVMATVNSDTWATEIGGLSRRQPRSIVTGKRVTAGTSGGISGLGLAASAAGGLFIGATAWIFIQVGTSPFGTFGWNEGQQDAVFTGAVQVMPLLLSGLVAGLIGSLCDSWLGATVQVMYRCGVCGKEVEASIHCGVAGKRIRGAAWMTNDSVNAISSAAGGLAAILPLYLG
jgi:uncharacterized protein (TIGR00297 family)